MPSRQPSKSRKRRTSKPKSVRIQVPRTAIEDIQQEYPRLKDLSPREIVLVALASYSNPPPPAPAPVINPPPPAPAVDESANAPAEEAAPKVSEPEPAAEVNLDAEPQLNLNDWV